MVAPKAGRASAVKSIRETAENRTAIRVGRVFIWGSERARLHIVLVY
jgi:hypothetical protein